ncbi:hypothetical protein [Nioella ostreopsis]|uniref:hypothetical protein n=1 Tax=Nioella ostreopsis TaxID=2448479 RepID=UPI000FD92E06|nr:hypothetical protein [Nioella ostreopsis]
MIRMIGSACLVSLAATAALAQNLPAGRYELNACSGNPYSDGVMELNGSEILFYESACTVSNPEAVRGMTGAWLYDAQCSGEGETWAARYMIMPGWDNDVVFVQEHWAGIYAYCGPVTPVAPAPAVPGGSSK